MSYAISADLGEWRGGFLVDDRVVDAAEVSGRRLSSVRAILSLDPAARAEMATAARIAEGRLAREVVLGPPIPDPDKIVCVGLNYRDHASESGIEPPTVPTLFAKFRNALAGSGSPIVLPQVTSQADYEGELAVVIGRRCKEVSAAAAAGVIAGYMPLNDVSARDLQLATTQWTAGKAIDGFAPCGPCLVTADEVDDPQALELTTRVNGDVVQHAGTSDMIFTVAELIEFISSVMTLEVGDVIATGTPAGVGMASRPPRFLDEGDVVEVEISGLGVLRNLVTRAG